MGNVQEASGAVAARREGVGCIPRRRDALRGAAVRVWGRSWGWSTWGTRGPGQGPGTSVEGWAGLGMHGAHRTGPGDVEPGRGGCQKGGVCPGGAGKVMGCGLGAGRVVGMWDVLGGLGARVG